MILLTNGCSWTWGGGLNLDKHDRLRANAVWPKKLGDLVQAEKTYNLSTGCGSNQRIVRTTFDWIMAQSNEDLEKTVAIIQWTELSRYEFYYPENYSNEYENHQDRWVRAKIDCILNPYDRNEVTKKKYNDLRLSTYTEIEGMYRFIGDLLAVDNLLKQHNIPYYFWTHDANILEQFPKEAHEFCKDKFNWLNLVEYERVSESDDHPSLTGHKQIAHILAEHIKPSNHN